MTHEVFTIIAPVRPGCSADLRSLLQEIDKDPGKNRLLPFGRLPMVHFASFVVFSDPEQARDQKPKPVLLDHLVFESCIDGSIDDYLEALLHLGLQTLHDLLSYCEGYKEHAPSHQPVKDFLLGHRRKAHLLHIGNPGLKVKHIKAGNDLRRILDIELDDLVRRRRSVDRPLDLMRTLRERLNVPPSTRKHWFLEEPSREQLETRRFGWFADQQTHRMRPWYWGKLIAWTIAALGLAGWLIVWLWSIGGARAIVGALIAAVVGNLVFWRWLKRGKPFQPPSIEKEHDIRAIKELEDKTVQNKMASLVILKAGWPRWMVTRIVLGLFNMVYRTVFTDITPGRLAGLHTIHFGHWTVVDLMTRDGGTQKGLMFLSNYDGSWETYLDDFLANLFNGVVAIWAGGVDFPSPLDGPIFKSWARTRMSAWHAWYQAYRGLTVANIENNDKIRLGLVDLQETDDAARLWLSRFGSFKTGNEHIDEPGDALETYDIQGLVLSGYAHLPSASYSLLRVNDPDAVRKWLTTLAPHVTDARQVDRGLTPAVNVAFTHSGLKALGLEPCALARFPFAFQEGMAPKDLHHRSRVLGDVGDNTPKDWEWGGSLEDKNRVDILLMIYAKEEKLKEAVAERLGNLEESKAATVVKTLHGKLLGDDPNEKGRKLFREHFGFADGISQPEIEGTHRASSRIAVKGSQHLVKPGEFLLGYMAGDGAVAPGIPVDASLDGYGLLPPHGSGVDGLRDFGRNGTFLVFRQLEQDVIRFREFIESAGGASAPRHDVDELAARMVGRRQDGQPLVSSPPESAPNEFEFSGDPHGFTCPIGAHIRRANPRDSLLDDPVAALKSANRHRLLRRGRPYGEPLAAGAKQSDGKRGMLFICLNGDIERQFEFVQQNWINASVFSGLACEQDGLVGTPSDGHGCLTVQAPTVRQRTLGIPSFIRMRGGEYFFLPGLSAFRYLAALADAKPENQPGAAATLPSPLPAIVGTQPSRLRRALVAFEGWLPGIRLAWAARYSLLMAFVLVFWPVVAARNSTLLGNHFLIGWWGLVGVSFLASLAAFAVMIALRLVLLYGWRSRPGNPRWTGSARWFQVLGFQALALPLVLAAIHRSAQDEAVPGGDSYWDLVVRNLGAGAIGMLAAIALLTLASSLQSLRPGSRPDLFFPPNPLSKRLGGPVGIRLRLRRPAQLLSRLSQWIVNSVPEEIGTGYIDYRRQRILPGHAFAAFVALIVFLVYVVGYVTLNPAWESTWLRWGHQVPALAYLIFMLIIVGSLLSMLAFFLDRYGIPTLLPLALWLALVASVARTDHFYPVQGVVEPAPLGPAEVVRRGQLHYPQSKVIVVASEGLGLTSSAWTAEVLARLAETGGRPFTDSVRLISASSGASLGTMYFVERYENTGFPTAGDGQTANGDVLNDIRKRSSEPSDNENAWGLVYPDLARTFAPLFVPSLLDRGWAMEQAWRGRMRDAAATLDGWRQNVADGWRPSTAFGVTLVETGGRHVFATYDANPCADPTGRCPDQVTHHRDVQVVTAARLAATFPYVTPVSRAQVDAPAYHLTDGGFWDNFGVVAAIEWLKQAAPALKAQEVMLIEIRSSPGQQPAAPDERAWIYEVIGPLRTMNEVRMNAQRVRNDSEVSLLKDLWPSIVGPSEGNPPLAHAIFKLGDPEAKLSWRIGRSDLQRMKEAWTHNENQASLAKVRAFLGLQ